MFSSKALSPVIAVSLLIVISVSAVVGFQVWFQTYSSSLFIQTEEKQTQISTSVELLGDDSLYLQFSEQQNLTFLNVEDSKGNLMCDFTQSTPTNGSLLAHWTFNQEGKIIEDISGNGYNGTYFGNTLLYLDFDNATVQDKSAYDHNSISIYGDTNCSVQGISGTGCYFDGADDYIHINSDPLINSRDSFTISVWTKYDGLGEAEGTYNNMNIITRTSTHYVIKVRRSDETPQFRIVPDNYPAESSVDLVSNNKISNSSWTHLVGTYYNGDMKLYKNGDLVASYSFENSTSINSASQNLYLGAYYYGSCADSSDVCQDYNGTLDEIVFYSKALTASEVNNLYSLQKATFIDFKNSALGKELHFDGKDDYLNFSYVLNGLSNVSIVAKVRGVDSYNFFNSHKTNEGWTFLDETGFKTSSWAGSVVYPENMPDYSSYKIVTLTKEGNQTKRYVDGVNDIDFEINEPWTTMDLLYMGRRGNGVESYHKGIVDEVRIYNKTLNQQEVLDITNHLILPQTEGVNKISMSACNLTKGEKYTISYGTNNRVYEETSIAR